MAANQRIKVLTSRYKGRCRGCGSPFPAGTRIGWAGKRTSYHEACIPAGEAPQCAECRGSGTVYVGITKEPVPCPTCHEEAHEALRQKAYPNSAPRLTRAQLAVCAEAEDRGATMTWTNSGGRCEDAPCCGCCT